MGECCDQSSAIVVHVCWMDRAKQAEAHARRLEEGIRAYITSREGTLADVADLRALLNPPCLQWVSDSQDPGICNNCGAVRADHKKPHSLSEGR